jgi:hypothetical protein
VSQEQVAPELLALWRDAQRGVFAADAALAFVKAKIEERYALAPTDTVDDTTGVITRTPEIPAP